MLQCYVVLTLFAHYICLHGYIHFIYLFNPNTKCRDMYTANQEKNKEILIFAHIALPYYEETCISSYFALLWPQERSQKLFFSLTEFMPFKFKYKSNFNNILLKNLNVVFQPI